MKSPPPKLRRQLETIVIKRARCPRCAGTVLRKYRSLTDQGDGSAVSWVRCANAACGHRFRIVQE